MTIDTAAEHAAAPLPELVPVLVATDDEGVEELLRAARVDIARLSLELRVANHKADAAERTAADVRVPDPMVSGFDLQGARELLQSSLGQRVAARRTELAAELDAARIEAARVVASAQRRAEAYVSTAHDGVLANLLEPGQPLRSLPPLSPVVAAEELAGEATGAENIEGSGDAPPAVDQRPPLDEPATALGVASILTALQPFLAGQAAAIGSPTATPPAASIVSVPKAPSPSLVSRLLFADVLLPLIAVVVVLIILVAWVG